MNEHESDVTTNKRGLFYSKPTLPSLPDFCSFSRWKNKSNSVNTNFRTKKQIFFKCSQIT